MFLIVALLCFVLALFKVDLAGLDLVILGWIFVTLHFLVGDRVWSPIRRT
jgi:hypothetical protein